MRRLAGVALIAAAIGVALAGQQQYHGDTAEEQQTLERQLVESEVSLVGEQPVAQRVPLGSAFTKMRIPRFGQDWEWVTLEGIRQQDLDRGPGHFPRTALPGARGNSSWAAHRAGHGDPFIDFDRLRLGDKVYVEQGRTTWTYEITTRPEIIDVSDVWVLDRFAPGRWMTLTTCWPKYGSSHRMYARARLTAVS